jgi:hypothetical protein
MTLRNLTLVLTAMGIGCVGSGSAMAETPTAPQQVDVSQTAQATLLPVAFAKLPPAQELLAQVPLIQAESVDVAVAVNEPAALQGKPLDNSALGDLRGSGGIVVGNQTLNAITSGNSTIGNYTAGAVNISQSALSNFNGLGNITINTGAMSQLQSAMNVTVNVTP